MKKLFSLFCVIALVGTFCGACKNKPGKETGSVTIEYKIVNQIESDIVVELKFGDEQVMTIEPGDTQVIYSSTEQYEGSVPPEPSLSEKVLEAEMEIDEGSVPEEIWMYDNWDDNVENSGKDYLHTYTLTITDELLNGVWPERNDVSYIEYSIPIERIKIGNIHLFYLLAEQEPGVLGVGDLTVINSEDEMAEAVEGDYPEIDFSKQTLILIRGIVRGGVRGRNVESFRKISAGKYELQVNVFLSGIGEPTWFMELLADKIDEKGEVDLILKYPME